MPFIYHCVNFYAIAIVPYPTHALPLLSRGGGDGWGVGGGDTMAYGLNETGGRGSGSYVKYNKQGVGGAGGGWGGGGINGPPVILYILWCVYTIRL